jgi:hypothetical protein
MGDITVKMIRLFVGFLLVLGSGIAAALDDPEITENTIVLVPNAALYYVQSGDKTNDSEDKIKDFGDNTKDSEKEKRQKMKWRKAPFGSGGGDCPLQESIESDFPADTTITLSKWVKIPEGAYNMRMLVSVDNDAIIYVNGIQVDAIEHEYCPLVDENLVHVPDDIIIPGQKNLVKVIVIDRGAESFFDQRILIDVPCPSLDGCPAP